MSALWDEENFVSCCEDLELLRHSAEQIAFLADRAYWKLQAGDPVKAMRLVQRVRYQMQFRAELMKAVMGDLNNLATGEDDFDHAAWLKGVGERDFSEDERDLSLGNSAYMAGLDLLQRRPDLGFGEDRYE